MKRCMFYFTKAFMAVLMVAALSCSKDEAVSDPEGTITANITENDWISIIEPEGLHIGGIRWHTPDNILVSKSANTWYLNYKASICNLGAMKGLGNITKIPTSGYSPPHDSYWGMECEQGHGYVVKLELGVGTGSNWEGVGECVYVRLYVEEPIVSTSGDIMGAKVRYQYPFEP